MTLDIVYPEIRIEVNLNDVWTDITSYVVSNITGDWGIDGNTPLDRVAKTGTMNFLLNNEDKRFTPFSSNALSGWQKNIEVRLVISIENMESVRWKGFIVDIGLDSGEFGSNKYAEIRCLDWMNKAAEFPITLQQTVINKRAEEGVQLVLDAMPIEPDDIDFQTGTDTFATIFDTIKTSTRALSEFSKLILSEFGYLYLKKDRVNGETLKVESRHSRDGASQAVFPVSKYEASILGQESGFALLFEDGSEIALDETQSFISDNDMLDMDITYGGNVLNHVAIKNYPRYVDPSTTVLFNQDTPIPLAAGETKYNIKGNYTDVYGQKVSGASMITPVITTDYLMYQNSDATGTNLSANLVIDVTLGTDGVVFNSVTNSGGTAGYITKLRTRGNAVYTYNSVEQFQEDADSILDNGYKEVVIEQKYSSTLLPNATIVDIILNQEKDPRIKVDRVYYLANTSYELMAAFIFFDVGSLFQLIENENGINSSVFIQDITFDISLGGMIDFSWGLKEATSLSEQYWQLETVGFGELESTTYVGY